MRKTKFIKNILFILSISITGIILYGCRQENADIKGGKNYTATAQGYGGDVTVNVTVTNDGKIGAINVDAPKETAEIGGKAAPEIAKQILETQSLSVDVVSGATITSNAVLSATESALKDAGVDTEALKKK